MTKTNETKVTKRMRFEQARADYLALENTEMVAFFDHEIELLDKKNAKKGGKTNAVTQAVKAKLIEYMQPNTLYTATQLALGIQPEFEDTITSSRVTSALTKLTAEEIVKNVKEKGKSYYQIIG